MRVVAFLILASILCAANVPRAGVFIQADQAGFGPIAVDSAGNTLYAGFAPTLESGIKPLSLICANFLQKSRRSG